MAPASSAEALLPARIRTAAAARAVPYRPDIDGLRAISVLAVILFHAKVPGFAGGFVGVDVFFVISGYLITQVLMASSELSVAGQLHVFYVRRCRRILPALLVMLLVTAALARWLFIPADLMPLVTQLSATSVFAANVVAWRTGGYFDLQTPFNPLAHLWSIAVEEQFYVVFPLFFLASGRAREPGRLAWVAAAALLSFALCLWASYAHPRANFFLAPTRAWELLLGSLVALGAGGSLAKHSTRNVLAGAALLALAGCVMGYDGAMRYPGLAAVVPCTSAAILLAATGGSRSGLTRWLSAPALVFTGLISYSLYLWHLPVLAFATYYNIVPLEPRHLAVLLTSVYLLAAASWRYIETPVRRRTLLGADARFLPAAGAATLAIAVLGLVLWGSGGQLGRADEVEARLIDNVDRLSLDAVSCSNRSLADIAAGSLCSYGPASGAIADVVVWGDSHAIALLPAYEQIATAHNVRVYAAVLSSCRPLLDVGSKIAERVRRPLCDDFNRAVVDAIDKIDPALVVLNAYWMYPDLALETAVHGAADSTPFEIGFDRTLKAIGSPKRKVCVIGDVPTLKYRMPYAYITARRRGIDPAFIALRSDEADQQLREVEGYFAEVRQRRGLSFVDLKAALCTGPACALITPDGRSVYRDDNHLSVAGAEFLRPSLEACFDGIE